MSDDPTDEAIKKVEIELDIFGKRARPHFHLVGDLSLCMRTCNTPELRMTLSAETRRIIAELEREANTLDNKLKKLLEDAAKRAAKAKNAKIPAGQGAKPLDIPAEQKKAKLKLKITVDKFNKKYLPSDHSIWLEPSAKTKNEFPFIDYKKPTVMLKYKIKF
ncbi:MAG: hypothetical protein L3J36_14540 [Rhodobacteraceae bacterium]|nr:hypothetical protein [Paracoccaceae bacterium]